MQETWCSWKIRRDAGSWSVANVGNDTVFTFTDSKSFGVMATVKVLGVTNMVNGDDYVIV